MQYRTAGTNRAAMTTFQTSLTGNFISSISVGVISKPMNFNENTARATNSPLPPRGNQPPLFEMLANDQLPLVKKRKATNSEMIIIE